MKQIRLFIESLVTWGKQFRWWHSPARIVLISEILKSMAESGVPDQDLLIEMIKNETGEKVTRRSLSSMKWKLREYMKEYPTTAHYKQFAEEQSIDVPPCILTDDLCFEKDPDYVPESTEETKRNKHRTFSGESDSPPEEHEPWKNFFVHVESLIIVLNIENDEEKLSKARYDFIDELNKFRSIELPHEGYDMVLSQLLKNQNEEPQDLYVSTGSACWFVPWIQRMYREDKDLNKYPPRIRKIVVRRPSKVFIEQCIFDESLEESFLDDIEINLRKLSQDRVIRSFAEEELEIIDWPGLEIPPFHGYMFGDHTLTNDWGRDDFDKLHVQTPLIYRHHDKNPARHNKIVEDFKSDL